MRGRARRRVIFSRARRRLTTSRRKLTPVAALAAAGSSAKARPCNRAAIRRAPSPHLVGPPHVRADRVASRQRHWPAPTFLVELAARDRLIPRASARPCRGSLFLPSFSSSDSPGPAGLVPAAGGSTIEYLARLLDHDPCSRARASPRRKRAPAWYRAASLPCLKQIGCDRHAAGLAPECNCCPPPPEASCAASTIGIRWHAALAHRQSGQRCRRHRPIGRGSKPVIARRRYPTQSCASPLRPPSRYARRRRTPRPASSRRRAPSPRRRSRICLYAWSGFPPPSACCVPPWSCRPSDPFFLAPLPLPSLHANQERLQHASVIRASSVNFAAVSIQKSSTSWHGPPARRRARAAAARSLPRRFLVAAQPAGSLASARNSAPGRGPSPLPFHNPRFCALLPRRRHRLARLSA